MWLILSSPLCLSQFYIQLRGVKSSVLEFYGTVTCNSDDFHMNPPECICIFHSAESPSCAALLCKYVFRLKCLIERFTVTVRYCNNG